MRIFIVSSTLNVGGGETQMCRLAVALRARGVDAQVLTIHGHAAGQSALVEYLLAHDFPLHTIVHERDKLAAMYHFFQATKPEAIIASGYPANLDAALAAADSGVPVRLLYFENTGFVRDEFPMTDDVIAEGIGAATGLVGNCEAVVADINNYAGAAAIEQRMIPNGVDLPAEIARFDRKPFTAGMLANYRPDGLKNHHIAIEAAAMLDDISVQLYGRGDRQKLEQLARAIDNVGVNGPIDSLQLMLSWNAALNLSRTEGMSNAIMEAMAYGLPIIATDAGGNREIVEDGITGYIVRPKAEDVAMAIRMLWRYPSRAKAMGACGRERIAELYNWDRVCAMWLAYLGA